MSKRKGAASSERSGQEETKSTAEGDLKETQGALASDQSYLAELNANCEAKGKEWEVRQKEAQEEMGAIAKAKEILEGGVKMSCEAKGKEWEVRQKEASEEM